jgi:predicted metal-dependent enzyme (double-stranded beta helix superfamily)
MTSYIVPPSNDWASLGFIRHPNGYLFKELTPSNFPWEIILFVWPPGTRSKAHGHGSAWNLTWLLPLGNQATLHTTLFKVYQDQLQVDRISEIAGNQFHYVAPHQIHEVANESQNTAVTLHLYFPRRHR